MKGTALVRKAGVMGVRSMLNRSGWSPAAHKPGPGTREQLSGNRTELKGEERGRRCRAGETGLSMAGEEREVGPSEKGQHPEQTQRTDRQQVGSSKK